MFLANLSESKLKGTSGRVDKMSSGMGSRSTGGRLSGFREDSVHAEGLHEALRIARAKSMLPPVAERVESCKMFLDRARQGGEGPRGGRGESQIDALIRERDAGRSELESDKWMGAGPPCIEAIHHFGKDSDCGHWSSWADCLPMVQKRHPHICGWIGALTKHEPLPLVHAVLACEREVQVAGLDAPPWHTLTQEVLVDSTLPRGPPAQTPPSPPSIRTPLPMWPSPRSLWPPFVLWQGFLGEGVARWRVQLPGFAAKWVRGSAPMSWSGTWTFCQQQHWMAEDWKLLPTVSTQRWSLS